MIDGTDLNAKQIFELMRQRFLGVHSEGEYLDAYYCGITNNVEENLRRHNIAQYLVACRCDNANIAAEVERLLHDTGFDTGNTDVPGNGGTDDSVIVYMYKKSDETIE